MLSAIPDALLYMIVNWSESNQGSNPKENKVLQSTRGLLFILPFFLSKRTDLGPWRVALRLEMANLKSRRAGWWSKRGSLRMRGQV